MDNSEENKVVSLSGAKYKGKKAQKPEKHVGHEEVQSVIFCSFCGRPNTAVIKMIQGPGVNICSECTMIAVQYLILEDKIPSDDAQKILHSLWTGCKK
ncbi:MAG: ClpX C4-type zinc finger protein [Candidatus Gastranaerophilaceae bacterium]|jgi:hypothetical protein